MILFVKNGFGKSSDDWLLSCKISFASKSLFDKRWL